MKKFILLMLFSLSAEAMVSYPLQFGIGVENCHPNKDGLKECSGQSPLMQEISIPLEMNDDGVVAMGYESKAGTFEKIGYQASVMITHFLNQKIDDMITLKVRTWSLANPQEQHEVVVESFAATPGELSRLNLPGFAIGTEEDYSNITVSIRKSTGL